jgi:hypothetical protein
LIWRLAEKSVAYVYRIYHNLVYWGEDIGCIIGFDIRTCEGRLLTSAAFLIKLLFEAGIFYVHRWLWFLLALQSWEERPQCWIRGNGNLGKRGHNTGLGLMTIKFVFATVAFFHCIVKVRDLRCRE